MFQELAEEAQEETSFEAGDLKIFIQNRSLKRNIYKRMGGHYQTPTLTALIGPDSVSSSLT